MRIELNTLKTMAKRRGLGLSALLREAGVSKTAFYSLVRRPSILPKSVESIARELNVSPAEFLEFDDLEVFKLRKRRERLEEIMQSAPESSRENIWHTLILRELSPLERLNRSLQRGRGAALFKERAQIS